MRDGVCTEGGRELESEEGVMEREGGGGEGGMREGGRGGVRKGGGRESGWN